MLPVPHTRLVVATLLTAGIGTGGALFATTEPPTTTTAGVIDETTIDDERCAANRAAGELVFLSGFNHAASASGIDVMVALDAGYYEQLCLDVVFEPSFSTVNYPLVAAGTAHFSAAGSFSELLSFAAATDAELVAVTVQGSFPIDTVISKDPERREPADLAGTTIGIKGRIPASVAVMLANVGLTEHDGYQTVLVDGFDPLIHYAIEDLDGFTAHRSNEPGTLERADLDFVTISPADFGVPGSHGVTYTAQAFLTEHPTAAEDFVRASLRGFADAVADPHAAVSVAAGFAAAADDPSFDLAAETFRWTTEATLISDAAAGQPFGVPDVAALQAELDAYSLVDYFTTMPPAAEEAATVELTAALYDDDGVLIWPRS